MYIPHPRSQLVFPGTTMPALSSPSHSFTLRGPLDTLLRLMVPEHYRRSVYSLTSGLALGVTMYLWQPMPQPVWSISNTTAATIVSGECKFLNGQTFLEMLFLSTLVKKCDVLIITDFFQLFRCLDLSHFLLLSVIWTLLAWTLWV